jgi:hypothetical protein
LNIFLKRVKNMTIESAATNHAKEIAPLHAESWRVAYRNVLSKEYLDGDIVTEFEHRWRAKLMSSVAGQKVLFAKEGGALVGFICAYLDNDLQWGTEVENLHVQKNFQRIRKVGA